jgi:glycerophosphoryl diester phosphodiesterase
VAFVGHTPPKDPGLFDLIHARGAICMAGTSRNLDLRVISPTGSGVEKPGNAYRALMKLGADLIETDLPANVGPWSG